MLGGPTRWNTPQSVQTCWNPSKPVQICPDPFEPVGTRYNLSKHVTQSVQTCWNTFPADPMNFLFYIFLFYTSEKSNAYLPPPPFFPLPPFFPPNFPIFFFFGGGGEGRGTGRGRRRRRGATTTAGRSPPRRGGDKVPPPSPPSGVYKSNTTCTYAWENKNILWIRKINAYNYNYKLKSVPQKCH
jgi:hypothetical protein